MLYFSTYGHKRKKSTEKQEVSDKNPIARSSNIAHNESTIAQYYAGIKAPNKKRVFVYTRVLSTDPWYQIK